MLNTALRASALAAACTLPRFRLADAAPDPRGWTVITSDERSVGIVSRLIVELRTGIVRYFVVDLSPALERRARRTPSRSVLIPVGMARAVDDVCAVLVDISSETLRVAPRIPDRPITRQDEELALEVLGLPALAYDSLSPYRGGHFEERRLLAPRH
jgi:hypothetical protein